MLEVTDRIVRAIPREFFLEVTETFPLAFEKVYAECSDHDPGHRAYAAGLSRHVRCNEALVSTFKKFGIAHAPLSGTKSVRGDLLGISIGRFNMLRGEFDRVRKTKGRLEIAGLNEWIAAMVQPDLFDYSPSKDGLGLFIATASSSSWAVAKHPQAILVVVTDHDFQNVLYKATLQDVLALYAKPASQEDRAFPRLKNLPKEADNKDNES